METPMSLKTKFAAVAVAAVTLIGAFAVTSEAQARPRWGTALGVGIAAGVLFGAAAASAYEPVYEYRRCRFVRQFDAYGDYVGTVRVCDVY
jgi:hypothetical protein